MSKQVQVWSYTLYSENGEWLGQVTLTSDGMFGSVTDYGNLSYAWRHTGSGSFKEFLLGLNTDYFGRKMAEGLAYICYNKKVTGACMRFAEKILPALQKELREEMENNSPGEAL